MNQKATSQLFEKKLSWRKSFENESFDVKKVEKFVTSLKLNLIHGSNKSYYVRPSPECDFPNHISGDYIKMPLIIQFNSINEYYFNLFHEISHWTEIRVNFHLTLLESELIAEIVSNKLCNKFKIKQSVYLNYDHYVDDWIKELQNNKSFLKQCLIKSNIILKYLKKYKDAK
jgi:antirestriction protein ArdC